MKRALLVLPAVVMMLAIHVPGPAARPLSAKHGCGAFKVASHPWEQFLNGQEGATGTGWLLYWQGRGGSCNFSIARARAIIDNGAVPHKLKHDCDSEKVQTPGNWIEPFHTLTCHVVGPKKANYSFQAFVDPTSAQPVSTASGAIPLLAVPAAASARKIIETTPQGYGMTLKVKGKGGKLRISCPNGSSLGGAKFKLKGKNFTASNGSWTFSGKVDKVNHFKGSGSTKGPKCGAGVGTSFSEPVPTTVVWTVCPNNDVLSPIPANTPLTFKGVLAGAALGTQLRIEYTDPGPAITDVVHVTTDAAGNFGDTHAFPSSNGSEYGADATARYPDQSLATGVPCGLFIQ